MSRAPQPPDWKFRWIAFPLARFLAGVLLFICGPSYWKHRNRIPKKGGVIILANHISDADPVILQWACPRHIYFMAKQELWEMKGVAKMLDLWRAFPVVPGTPDKGAIAKAVELAKAGNVVCIFPEGKLSRSGELEDLQLGAGLIVKMAGVKVMCAGIVGTNKIRPVGGTLRMARQWVKVRFGEPREFESSAKAPEIIEWAEDEICGLTPEINLRK